MLPGRRVLVMLGAVFLLASVGATILARGEVGHSKDVLAGMGLAYFFAGLCTLFGAVVANREEPR